MDSERLPHQTNGSILSKPTQSQAALFQFCEDLASTGFPLRLGHPAALHLAIARCADPDDRWHALADRRAAPPRTLALVVFRAQKVVILASKTCCTVRCSRLRRKYSLPISSCQPDKINTLSFASHLSPPWNAVPINNILRNRPGGSLTTQPPTELYGPNRRDQEGSVISLTFQRPPAPEACRSIRSL